MPKITPLWAAELRFQLGIGQWRVGEKQIRSDNLGGGGGSGKQPGEGSSAASNLIFLGLSWVFLLLLSLVFTSPFEALANWRQQITAEGVRG